MAIRYVINNLLTEDSLCCTSSEDLTYTMENLYAGRPSKPFRFTGVGSAGNPEWICLDFDVSGGQQLTFMGIFNHNLSALAGGNDELSWKACDDPCIDSGMCDWDNPDEEESIKDRIVSNFKNLYYRGFDWTFNSYRIDFIDEDNEDGYIEIGELVVGIEETFGAGVRLTPGRADGPEFFMSRNETHYGQIWMKYLAKAQQLSIRFTELNDPETLDELHHFMNRVMGSGGKFVIVPDDSVPFAFYVAVQNFRDYSQRVIYNPEDQELREWTLQLRTLTEGIRVL